MLEFKINELITLKLEEGNTTIYVKGERVNQCKHLLLDIPVKEISSFDSLESIDEAAEKLSRPDPRTKKSDKIEIAPEEDFWGHCSNLQVWVENNYNTRLLHRTIAFSLLRKLYEAGDPLALKVFKEEIVKRIESGYPNVIKYLIYEHYLKFFNKEEIRFILLNPDGSLKDYFQCVMEDHRSGEILFRFASENFNREDFLNLCLDEEGHFKAWIKNKIHGSGNRSLVTTLLEKGEIKAKLAINYEMMNHNFGIMRAIRTSEKIEYKAFFSSYSKAELQDLFFDENNNFRDWLNYYVNDTLFSREIGYPLLMFLYKRGFEQLKEYFVKEIENGNDELLTRLDYAGIFGFFSKEELEVLCFSLDESPNLWFAEYFIDKSKNDRAFGKLMNRGFSILEKLIGKGSKLAKQEFLKRIEEEHPYTKTMWRRKFEQFGKREFHDLCFDSEENFKPWLINLINDETLRYEFRYPPLKILAERGNKKAKDEIIRILKTDFNKVIGYYDWKKYNELFTEEEYNELFVFTGIKDLYGSQEIGEFRVNDYLVLKLEEGVTNTYVKGEKFSQCKNLLVNLPIKNVETQPIPPEKIENVDILARYYEKSWNFPNSHSITHLTDLFWGYCSNMQVWAENNYDLTLLYSEYAIPLLKKLRDAGDPVANKVFKKELENNIEKHLRKEFMQALSDEELTDMLGEFVRIKEHGIRLVDKDELNLRNETFLKLDDVTGFEKLTTLKKLTLGMSNDYYEIVLVEDHFDMYISEDDYEDHMLSNINGLGAATTLEELNIKYTCITDISELGKLTHLKKLKFTKSKIKELQRILSCVNLETLNLHDNYISKIPDVSSLNKLEVLDLGSNKITKIENLNLPNLKELNLGDNKFLDIENLDHLENLRILVLFKDQIEEITGLDNLINLRTLNLRVNKITVVDGLENLTKLENLYLDFNQITEIKNIDKLTRLKELTLPRNKLEKVPDAIGNLKLLVKLELQMNQLQELPETIGNLSNLESLHVNVNQILNIPKSIGHLKNLKIFNLRSNKIQELPDTIGNLENLIDLNAKQNKLTRLPSSIGRLTLVKSLNLENNSISELPDSMGRMESLEELILKQNPLKKLPKSLTQLKHLKYLDLRETELEDDEETQKILSALRKNKVLIYNPEQVQRIETKDIKVRGIEDFLSLNVENWNALNDIAWQKLLRAKKFKEIARVSYYLRKLGRRTGDIEIFCYGLDIFAVMLSKSKKINALKKSIEIHEYLNSINTSFSSGSEDAEWKIRDIKLWHD